MRADPGQTRNLLADVRIGRDRDRLLTHIPDPELKSLVAGFQVRSAEIMKQTGGTVEPNWQA